MLKNAEMRPIDTRLSVTRVARSGRAAMSMPSPTFDTALAVHRRQ